MHQVGCCSQISHARTSHRTLLAQASFEIRILCSTEYRVFFRLERERTDVATVATSTQWHLSMKYTDVDTVIYSDSAPGDTIQCLFPIILSFVCVCVFILHPRKSKLLCLLCLPKEAKHITWKQISELSSRY